MNAQDKTVYDLENKSIKKLLWKYFLPAFAGVAINTLYNIVDRIFIGQGVGALALSGLSAIFPIMIIMMAFGMLVGMGAGVRISINMGKKDFDRAERVLGNAFVLLLIISVILTIVGFLVKDPLLQIFGVGEETIGYANDYLNIILIGTVFNMMGYGLNNLIRSEGSAKVAMQSMFLSAGVNLVLDPIFIFVFDMGVKGAALATVISMMVLTIWVLKHFLGSNSIIKLRPRNFILDRKIIAYILTIGFAPFAMQIAASFVQATYNTQLIKYSGDIAIGAMGIINSIAIMLVMSVIAINMAAQPIVGFNHGANNLKRVKETLILSMKAATVISVFGFITIQAFPVQIIKLFNSESKELLEIGVRGLRLFGIALPIVGFQIIVGNYFQSIGKAGKSAFMSLLRQVIVLIPILIMLPRIHGLDGVWMASPIADTVSAIICAAFLIKELKRLNSEIAIPL